MTLDEHIARLAAEIASHRKDGESDPGVRAMILLDHLPYMAWMKDTEGVFLAVNEPFARAAGRSRCAILGRTDRDIWPAALAERYLADDRQVIETAKQVWLEEPIAEPSGPRWVETYKTPVMSCDGRVVGTVGLARDITERKLSEEQRQKLEARIQHAEKLESLGLLAGGIAHDFNNLLVGVLSNAELALRRLSSIPEAHDARERVEQVRLAALHAADLTRQMLAYSGRGSFVIEAVDLNEVVRGSAQLLAAAISKKASLTCELAPGATPVRGDVAQLRQVVMNLITNASDALGDREGAILVETAIVELPSTDHVHSDPTREPLPPGTYACLRVTDDGCGMSDDTRARMFDPFFTTKFTGRGLGLAAVQGIVRGHGGGIAVESRPGAGTRFEVFLPHHEDALPAAPRLDAELSEWSGSGRALLVDDDEGVREVSALMLEELGFEVCKAEHGRAAIELFEADPSFAVVVLDMTMPDLNGDEVYERLRAIRPDVRVVLSSGYDEQDARSRVGARPSFLRKPYTIAALRAALRSALGP